MSVTTASKGGRVTGAIPFPPGTCNAYLFSAANALSVQVVLGSPMILYAKSLGASATVIGIVAGMVTLLVILQIPAARFIERVGYRRFVLGGWSTRLIFVLGISVVPLTDSFLDPDKRLKVLLLLLLCFNISRGVSSSAWLPWMTTIMPAELRGRYLLRDVAVQNLASLVSFAVSALMLSGQATSLQFALLFAFSAVTGLISLWFLKRIPDVASPEDMAKQKKTSWFELASYSPFARLLITLSIWSIAYGGIPAFTISFLKSSAGMSDSQILFINSTSFLGGVCSLWLVGSHLDRFGSRPILGFVCIIWLMVLGGWNLLAGRVIAPAIGLIVFLQFCMGLLAALANMALNRLAMAIIPGTNRNRFFALFAAVGNVTLGLSPIVWGFLIDLVGTRNMRLLGMEWNRFSLFFTAAAAAFMVSALFVRRLDESRASSLADLFRELLIEPPQRFWLRFWPRG